jgi:hypothetical protein
VPVAKLLKLLHLDRIWQFLRRLVGFLREPHAA